VKKVLIFGLAYYPRVGGAEVAIKEITDRLGDIEFHLITLRFSPADAAQERLGNVVVHRVGSGSASYVAKMLFIPRAAAAAARLHAQEKFNAAWVMMSYMLLPLYFARLNIPYVLTLQEGDTEAHMFGRLRILPFLPFINRGFKNARVVQAISTYLGEWAQRRGFTGPLEIIPNGVDLARVEWFSNNPVGDRSIFWKNYNGGQVSVSDKILITTSRLVFKNAIDIIIKSLKFLPDNVKLFVLGEGPLLLELKRLSEKLKLSDRVRFLGQVSNTKVVGYLHAADVFVRPSRSEGMGNSFVEAMAAGLPVIATREGGLADFITPQVAWPVPKDSPEAVAEAVKTILGNPAHTAQVIARAKQLAFEKYDWDLIARQMRERVFGRVLE